MQLYNFMPETLINNKTKKTAHLFIIHFLFYSIAYFLHQNSVFSLKRRHDLPKKVVKWNIFLSITARKPKEHTNQMFYSMRSFNKTKLY